MGRPSDTNALQTVLQQYGIQPMYIEPLGVIAKVHTQSGLFALKRIDASVRMDFVSHLQMLYQKGFHRIVPVYPTRDGRYGVLQGNDLYYLMPWLHDLPGENRQTKHEKLFRELARMHVLSQQETEVTEEERKEHTEATKQTWEAQRTFLEQFVEYCEEQWYMSPFELTYCMYYNDIRQACTFAINQLEVWEELMEEKQTMRSVLVHGKLSPEHFLYDEKGLGYFINFEQAKYASPLHDLLPFLARTLHARPTQHDDVLAWLQTYFATSPFRKEEMRLFLSYLAHPGPIVDIVERYYQRPKERRNEREDVRKLQEYHWRLKNIEYVVMKLEEEQKRREQAEKAAEAASTND